MRDPVDWLVAGGEDAVVRGRPRQKFLVVVLLAEEVDRPDDIPAGVAKRIDDGLPDVVVDEDREAVGHYCPRCLRYSVCSASISASALASEAKSAAISCGFSSA